MIMQRCLTLDLEGPGFYVEKLKQCPNRMQNYYDLQFKNQFIFTFYYDINPMLSTWYFCK